ncbi:C-type lectin domain-containing protein [Caenorhabditis elegans]|uniref:C-type lectin domain-containing protein n=1 Tax=Caenorhabditis elegans TaxID=6239 RepID=O16285_CAEEL|nr:C-type lectin domain-containing protein [Caenorhabditis elegans]CCD72105.2 C-type lectin domain-containing protein [Caenorhabditis elegans]|eukprot:NP_503546.3 C-type LECtin [Caenorhabditis elegans]
MLLQLFLSLFLASYAKSACFDGRDKEIKGLCFTFVPQQMTFNDARNWCHHQNPVTSSFLAYVPDQYTSNFLAYDARTAFETKNGNFWIGLSRNRSSSPFVWDNGRPVTYTNLGTQLGQNNLAQSVVNTKWNAFGENDKNFFVCSYDPAAPPTFSPPVITSTREPRTEDSFCKRTDRVTLLFAFSNDFNSQTVRQSWDRKTLNLAQYSGYAIARFDVRVAESIAYFTDYRSATAYLHSHLPDPRLGFGDKTTGSDSLQVIEKFYNNNDIPTCGSIILILSKRHPNNADISKTVSLVRQHHGIIHAVCSVAPSGGTQSKAMYNLTSKTNGVCNIGEDGDFDELMDYIPIYDAPYPIYCANPVLSGQNITELPQMNIPFSNEYWVALTIQDHAPIDSIRSLHFFITKTNDKYSIIDWQVYPASFNGILTGNGFTLSPVTYSMELQYDYTNEAEEATQFRVYSISPPQDWLPYCD